MGDLYPVLSSLRLAAEGVVAFSTEAPPRKGGANEHERSLEEVRSPGARRAMGM